MINYKRPKILNQRQFKGRAKRAKSESSQRVSRVSGLEDSMGEA